MANKNFVVRHGLEVSGNAGVAGNLGVSGTLSVGGALGVGEIDATALTVTNDASVGSALTVTGNTDLNGILQVSGNAKLTRHLQVSGNTSLKGTLQVNGNTSIGGVTQIKGNTSVGANLDVAATLSVAGNTNIAGVTTIGGNTDINGTLQVSGNTTISGKLTVPAGASTIAATTFDNGWFRIGNSTTGIAMDPNEIYFAGDGNVGTISGSLTLNPANGQILAGSKTLAIQTIDATGNIETTAVISGTQLRTASFRSTGILTVNGASYLSGSVQAKGTLSVGGRLTAGGDIQTTSLSITNGAQVGGALTVTGVTDLNGNTSVCGQLQVTGVLSGGQLRTSSFRTTGTLNVQGASYLSGSVQAKGNTSIGGVLTVTSSTNLLGNAAVAGTLSVQGASYLSGAVQVKGALSGNQLRCTSLKSSGTLNVQGGSYLSGTVQAKGVLSGAQLRCSSLRVTGGTAAICGSMDICGSLQVGGFVSATNYNFEMFGAVPAYNNSNYGTINWNTANSAIQLRSSTDQTIGMAFPAFRVNSATNVLGRWRITIQVKASAAASSGLYIRVYEYDGELPAGKVAVSNDATNAVVQEDTRNGSITGTVENVAIGTDWVTKTFYYSPTATAVYASVVVLNWSGIGTNHLYVRPPVIQPEYGGFVSATTLRTSSFRSTGALTVQGGSYLSGSVQAKGILSGLQLRCASLRVTGGTAAICGSMDICGSLQVAAVLSAGQFRGTSNNLQRGNISAMTYGQLNGAFLSASTLRCASFRITGNGTAAICGGLDVSGAIQAAFISGSQIRGVSATLQRSSVSLHNGTGVATYDKVRVWNSAQYTIGMTQGLLYGGLGSDYAMTFTMNNDISRGFLWRHADMTVSQGAMSLTTKGQLTVAHGMRLGFGDADTTTPTAQYLTINGHICCSVIHNYILDCDGYLQVSGAISCGGGVHAAGGAIQTTGIISGTNLRCTSFKCEETATISSTKTSSTTLMVRGSGNGGHILLYQYATGQTYTGVMQVQTAVRAGTTCFMFLGAYSSNGSDIEYVMRGNGQASADGAWYGGGIDYAEYFEWKDGNPYNEPRYGQPVYLISGEKIALATSGNIPIGVISKNPAFTGGSAWNKWEQKYLRDEWNAYILNADGERILNPDFDPDREYIPREQRSEWDAVGLMGKLAIQKDYITDTIRNNTNWLKMADINDDVERWLVK